MARPRSKRGGKITKERRAATVYFPEETVKTDDTDAEEGNRLALPHHKVRGAEQGKLFNGSSCLCAFVVSIVLRRREPKAHAFGSLSGENIAAATPVGHFQQGFSFGRWINNHPAARRFPRVCSSGNSLKPPGPSGTRPENIHGLR